MSANPSGKWASATTAQQAGHASKEQASRPEQSHPGIGSALGSLPITRDSHLTFCRRPRINGDAVTSADAAVGAGVMQRPSSKLAAELVELT